ncbi:MAG TPA: NAD(P)H-binding protein [Devosia sp.]
MIRSALVLGATGKSGRRLVPQLKARGLTVRAASRQPGDGHVPFDWMDPSSYRPALPGMDAVYLVTPAGVADPSSMVDALLGEARTAGVRRVVLVSSMGVEFPGEPTDSGRLKVERLVAGSGLEWTVLRPGGFNQNFSEDFLLPGVLHGEVATATGEGKVGFIDAADIAAVATATLTEDGHAGAIYTLTGPEALSFADAITIIGAAAGRPIGHREITATDLTGVLAGAGVPADYAAIVVRDQLAIRDGYGARLTDTVAMITGRPPIRFAEYAAKAAPVWAAAKVPA